VSRALPSRGRSCAGWRWTEGPSWPSSGWTKHTQEWRAISEEIEADILAKGVDPEAVLTRVRKRRVDGIRSCWRADPLSAGR